MKPQRCQQIFEVDFAIGEIEILEFEPEHGERILLNRNDPGLKQFSPTTLDIYAGAGPAFTGMAYDQVVAPLLETISLPFNHTEVPASFVPDNVWGVTPVGEVTPSSNGADGWVEVVASEVFP